MKIESKLDKVSTSIFSVMSKLANDYNAVNLSQGFPDYPTSQKLKDLVCKYIQNDHNQYAPMPGVPALLEQIADKIDQSYGWRPSPSKEITITTGASQAICSAISMVISPGDEAIIIEPAYDSYKPAISMNGGIAKVYEMTAPDFKVNWVQLEKLITPKTKMLVVNNPHNPTGTIFKETDIRELIRICQKHDLFIISDEVYEHLVFDGNEHLSLLKYPELRARGMAIFSFGKSLHATGWKTGYIIAPDFLTAEFRKVHQFTVFCVNTPVQHAIAEYMSDHKDWSQLSRFFETKRNLLKQGMASTRLKPLNCDGTYFHLFDYSAISSLDEEEFAIWLTKQHGVATIPLSPFYTSGRDQKLVRICFAKNDQTIKNAIEKLKLL